MTGEPDKEQTIDDDMLVINYWVDCFWIEKTFIIDFESYILSNKPIFFLLTLDNENCVFF